MTPGTVFYAGYVHLPEYLQPWREYLSEKNRWLSVSDWWNEVIFVASGHSISRRQLAMWASDKDGGAHSDVVLSDGYKAVIGMWTRSSSASESGAPTVVPHQHLYALRRFALEVLESPELHALAEGKDLESAQISSWPVSWAPIMDRAMEVSNVYINGVRWAHTEYDDASIGRALLLLNEIRRPFQTWRGNHLTRLKLHAAARDVFEEVLRDHPKDVHALYALGFLNDQLNENEVAEQYFKRALSIDPANSTVLKASGNLCLKLERFDDARSYYQRALAVAPELEDARINMKILDLSQRVAAKDDPIAALIELHGLYKSLEQAAGIEDVIGRLKVLAETDIRAVAALETLAPRANA